MEKVEEMVQLIVTNYNINNGELLIAITGDHTTPVNYGDHTY
jgi:2,3-bisphosphoglycerate-independent phosphoglycerate mutase